MDRDNRNFYHSFPRVRPGDSRDYLIQLGLEILRAIQQVGLVLAPEIVEWKQSLVNGEYRHITILQRRLCFTELARNQVEEHAKTFGPFSLEFRTDALRRLGALPVIYVPQRLKDDQRFSTLGATVVAELSDIKYTINQLQKLLV